VPTIDLVENLSPKYIVTESPQEFRVVQYPATSFSQSYINWNIIPPSPDMIFSRYIRVTLPVQITIQGHNTTGVGSNIVNTLYAGFCTYPLHQIISTLTITFNNQAITIKPSQIIRRRGGNLENKSKPHCNRLIQNKILYLFYCLLMNKVVAGIENHTKNHTPDLSSHFLEHSIVR
jgi:hypothetical protein